jgi:hypothetical protein
VTCSVLVLGLPSPAGCASSRTWQAAAEFVRRRLVQRFGSQITFEYVELFSPDMAGHPEVEAQVAAGEAVPPLVIIDGSCRFSGGKLNASAIERAVAAALASNVPVSAEMESPLL